MSGYTRELTVVQLHRGQYVGILTLSDGFSWGWEGRSAADMYHVNDLMGEV